MVCLLPQIVNTGWFGGSPILNWDNAGAVVLAVVVGSDVYQPFIIRSWISQPDWQRIALKGTFLHARAGPVSLKKMCIFPVNWITGRDENGSPCKAGVAPAEPQSCWSYLELGSWAPQLFGWWQTRHKWLSLLRCWGGFAHQQGVRRNPWPGIQQRSPISSNHWFPRVAGQTGRSWLLFPIIMSCS